MRIWVGALALVLGLGFVLSSAPVGSAAAKTPSGALEYVALGDSYSAGFGILPFSPSSPFTAPGGAMNGCYQADQDYPHRVAAGLAVALTDVTCSGAVTANITTTPQLTMTGQTAPAVQGAALSASTDIVTVSIGGNDLGFSTVAEHCIREFVSLPPLMLLGLTGAPASCQAYYTAASPGSDWTGWFNVANRLSGTVVPALNATFAAIKAAAPNAKVYVVGYPQIATSDTTKAGACFSQPLPSTPPTVNAVPFGPTDIVWLYGVEQSLVTAIATAAGAQGSNWAFIDNWTGTADHTLCDLAPGGPPWIAGFTTSYPPTGGSCDPATQQSFTYSSTTICVALGVLHPNEGGVAFLASQTAAKIGADFRGLHIGGDLRQGGVVTVTAIFPELTPGTVIDFELRSTPVALGSAAVGAFGGAAPAFTIPASVPSGSHTLVALVGGVEIASVGLTVALAASGDEASAPLLVAGLALVLAGVATLSIGRLRRRRPVP